MTMRNIPRSIASPFERNKKGDFVSADGRRLRRQQVIQVLATETLPWRTKFGSSLHLLRHAAMSEGLEELARVYVIEALAEWVPQVAVTSVKIRREEDKMRIHVRYIEEDLIDEVEVEVHHGRG